MAYMANAANMPVGTMPMAPMQMHTMPVGTMPMTAMPMGTMPMTAMPMGAMPMTAMPMMPMPEPAPYKPSEIAALLRGNRKRGCDLSSEARAAILYARECGIPVHKLANDFDVSTSTIYETQRRFQKHQTLESKPRSGRAPTCDSATVQQITEAVRLDPRKSLQELSAEIAGNPSPVTIKRALKRKNVQKSVARRSKPALRDVPRMRRKWRYR